MDGFSARYMSDQDQRTHVQWWFYRAQLLRGLLFCLSMRRTASNDSAGAEAATAGEEEAQPEASAVDSDAGEGAQFKRPENLCRTEADR